MTIDDDLEVSRGRCFFVNTTVHGSRESLVPLSDQVATSDEGSLSTSSVPIAVFEVALVLPGSCVISPKTPRLQSGCPCFIHETCYQKNPRSLSN